MKLENLKQLFHDQMRDLYDAENRLVKALPKMAEASTNARLKAGFLEHLEQTKTHVSRLEQIFQAVGESPSGKICQAMKGLVAEGEETISEDADPAVKDAALIAAAQRVEHYEMAGYGTVMAYAKVLKDQNALNLLKQTLQEEKATDEKLTTLAENVVNLEAA
jgi:ferritin-like metal-binding protein YciE